MEKILIVEDDQHMAKLLENELSHEGYETVHAKDGRKALELAESEKPDLILLDVMLPELNGFEVLRRLRKTSEVPVILETARDDSIDKVNGLNSGADDYIAKPFDIEELLARIKAVLRRFEKANPGRNGAALREGSVELNPDTMKASLNGNETVLSKTEFLLLKFFMENKGKVLSRNEIIDAVWGKDHFIDSGSVDVYVRFLRSKISEYDDYDYIKTIRGVGYIFEGKN